MNSVAYRLTKPNSLRARSQGMTLIELMIVVIVVAILGTVAVSSYRSYLIRANRTEARMALLRVQAAQEKFFLQNNRYASNSERDPNDNPKRVLYDFDRKPLRQYVYSCRYCHGRADPRCCRVSASDHQSHRRAHTWRIERLLALTHLSLSSDAPLSPNSVPVFFRTRGSA
jgi:prepilin-type N-terminal cleavage/methylation domain-containing protein